MKSKALCETLPGVIGHKSAPRAAGLALGYLADVWWADPQRGHPVALFGQAAAAVEHRTYSDSRTAGVAHTALLLSALAAVGVGIQRAARGPIAGTLVTAVATYTVLGGTSLARTGSELASRLERDDVAGARDLLPSLCGRDPAFLDADGLARAGLESVAENTSDAQVAPMLWGAVAGVPGLLVYRGANTLDAMIGYRNERYTRFGWAAAKFDDVLNYVPARVAGVLTAVAGRPGPAIRAWMRDAEGHPSPNAGVVEASFAGALGIRLGGETHYPHGVEMRPTLGDGPAPTTADLRRAVNLSRRVQMLATAVAVGQLLLGGLGFGVWSGCRRR